jgi:broad specificity phosphatase PhoE
MQITLIRHGKPDMPHQKIPLKKFSDWIDAYNTANLCQRLLPNVSALAIAKNSNVVICSHLSRSIGSALRLGVQPTFSDPIFREMEMPNWSLPSPAFSSNVWAVLCRLFWFAGLTSNAESFAEAKLRATHATEQLIKFAQEHDQIIFVGHGLLNRFIAKTLLKRGWLGPTSPGKKYWDYSVYTYATT